MTSSRIPLPAVRRTEAQWRSAITRNRAVAKVTSLDGAIQIYKGRYFWPLEPNHPGNEFDIETIAHSLATIPRWGGQTATPEGAPLRYSVAQHSVHVADTCARNYRKIVPNWDWNRCGSPALLGLLHDAPEGYGFADLVRPVKYRVEGYRESEDALMGRMIVSMNIPANAAIRECVRRIDNMMVFLERDELVGKPVVPYINEKDHPRITIHDVVPDFRVWSAEEAKERFIDRYQTILATDGRYNPAEYTNEGHQL